MRKPPIEEREIIAWDGEGINLSGEGKPQHYVLFGSSVSSDSPLVIREPTEKLSFAAIVDYVVDVAARHPHAIHVGYFFRYDQNMIVATLAAQQRAELYERNTLTVRRGAALYRISWVPGKRTTLSRIRDGMTKESVTIDDIAPFFGTTFVKAYESLCEPGDDWHIVQSGKAARGLGSWEDMPTIREYWVTEIAALAELARAFIDIMVKAGFELPQWYGPGALANYIIRTRKMREHLQNEQPPAVHEASKRAFFGGHVEQYQAGWHHGKVWGLDIRSAYPFALSQAPSLGAGRWVWSDDSIARFGVYHIRFHHADPLPQRAMPLPHRDRNGNITYPPIVDGWYWSPEAVNVVGRPGVEFLGGWEWQPDDPYLQPWAFLTEMYETRRKLIRMDNPCERAFKLGPNSLYGKLAQRIGWDERENKPPRSHCLPLAGWITSFCRARVWDVIKQVPPEHLLAVETDGVYITCDPASLPNPIVEGDELGDWEIKTYDSICYLQSGVYMAQKDGEWLVAKTRGIDAASIPPPVILEYVNSLTCDHWPALDVPQRHRFVGLGSAVARATHDKTLNPFILAAIHCRWEKHARELAPGENGKRVHIPELCAGCSADSPPIERLHPLVVRSGDAFLNPESAPYHLPWEKGGIEAEWRKLLEADREENQV